MIVGKNIFGNHVVVYMKNNFVLEGFLNKEIDGGLIELVENNNDLIYVDAGEISFIRVFRNSVISANEMEYEDSEQPVAPVNVSSKKVTLEKYEESNEGQYENIFLPKPIQEVSEELLEEDDGSLAHRINLVKKKSNKVDFAMTDGNNAKPPMFERKT